jgi:hypothetical protein
VEQGQFAIQFATAFVEDASNQLRALLAQLPHERKATWETDYAQGQRYHARAKAHYQAALDRGIPQRAS